MFYASFKCGFCVPYFQERPLYQFYLSSVWEQNNTRWKIWLGLVEICMVAEFPAALVRLMLDQDQVNITPDGAIWFGFLLDLSAYDDSVCEKENVVVCAEKILELIRLETQSGIGLGKRDLAICIQAQKLLEKKLHRKKYQEFIQLYKDIKLIGRMDTVGKKRTRHISVSGQDKIYRLLSCICIFMVCMVVFMFIGHILYGEFSFWKLFGSSLEKIGTESLLQ